ncbi:MAG: hypothetical protein HN413_08140 [Chloroflexi bacterium]|jgi:hypothetical protein|nr:hypothetical protein [Chloroflexota bacterium]
MKTRSGKVVSRQRGDINSPELMCAWVADDDPQRESFGMAFLSLLLTLGLAVGTFVLMIIAVAFFGG